MATGGCLDLFVTHLTNGTAAANKAQTEALHSFVNRTAEHTVVIAGDFNATPDSIQVKQLAVNWIDSYQITHPHDPGWTCCVADLTKSARDSIDKRVDCVFVLPSSPDVTIQDVQLVLEQPFIMPAGPLWASDHIGLLIALGKKPDN